VKSIFLVEMEPTLVEQILNFPSLTSEEHTRLEMFGNVKHTSLLNKRVNKVL
jgi:hypothetical protein